MARFYAPTTIFMDEIDALVSNRGSGNESESSRRVLAELLVSMDGATNATSAGANERQDDDTAISKNVMVLAATNRPQDLDEALRRRLEKRVYIPLPEKEGRMALVNISMKGLELEEDIDFDMIVAKTKGYSGADITNVCREAAMMPLRRRLKASGIDVAEIEQLRKDVDVPVSNRDFMDALKNISSSVSHKNLAFFEKWRKENGAN